MGKLRSKIWIPLIGLFTFLVFIVTPAVAQLATADVVGTVTDATGAIIPGAKVTLTNLGTGVTVANTTNATGDYAFNLLIPGQYTIAKPKA